MDSLVGRLEAKSLPVTLPRSGKHYVFLSQGWLLPRCHWESGEKPQGYRQGTFCKYGASQNLGQSYPRGVYMEEGPLS